MPLYAVVSPDDEPAEELVTKDDVEHVADSVGHAGSHLFVIKTHHKTCGDVAEALGIGKGESPKTGLVFKISASDGYYYRSFWDRLKEMEKT